MTLSAGEHIVQGAAGDLQLQVDVPTEPIENGPLVLICHPHPLYGGSLQNKVVHMLARGFNDNGLTTIRFNFRGVGKSQGEFDHGKGEADDVQTIADYVRQQNTHDVIWLAGFSFGGYVAVRAYKKIQAERLLLVAPSVTLYDMNDINNIQIPWSVIQGSDDEVIEPEAVKAWLALQQQPPTLHWLKGAGHFFHGRLNDLRDIIKAGI